MKAQKLDSHVGKTLRLHRDGSVPPDNPFVGRADAKLKSSHRPQEWVRPGDSSRECEERDAPHYLGKK
jgi:Glucose / Sorbosone dehydrogenase